MGKGQQGKNRAGQKPNKKQKQMSSHNKKQLAKLDKILQGRSQSKNKDNKKEGGFERNKNNEGKERGRQNYSKDRNFKGENKRNNKEWIGKKDQKTKQISKYGGKNKFNKHRDQDQQEQQKIPIIKGNPLFKIIPQNPIDDEFAALGGDSQQQQYEEEGEQNEDVEQEDGMQQGDEEQLEEEQGQQQEDLGEQDQEEIQQQQQDNEDEVQQQIQQQQNGQQQVEAAQQGQQVEKDEQEGNQNQGNQAQQNENNNQKRQAVDISVISLKIQQTIQILMNVKKLGEGKPRKFYISQLKHLIHQYYGYNFELITHFLDFFNPSEMIQFFQANETQRPLTIRTNTLKTRRKQLAQSLIQRGVNLDPLAEWSKVGIKIYQSKVPIGATPQYLAGHYMLQSASSLLPVMALDPQVGQKILDMAAAPGGKTTYIAQLMKNTGCIFANDLKKERLRALQFNLYRLGITNTAITCKDGKKYPLIFPATFDRVLLDAPCTGLGIIAKDHSIKANRLMIDIYKNSHLQKQLLLAAIDCCKVNGTIVYSTCSVSPLQNEQVVNYALKRRFVKIVDCNIQVGQQGLTKFVEKRFHVDLKKTRRIYPHVHNMDGFYVAKLVKNAKGKKQIKQDEDKEEMNIMQQYPNEENEREEVDIDA